MTPAGWTAILMFLAAQLGQLVTSWIQIQKMNVQIAELQRGNTEIQRGIAKENSNRRAQLEDKLDDLYRFVDRVRTYLWKSIDDGTVVIPDRSRLDWAVFIPPPRPRHNGNGK